MKYSTNFATDENPISESGAWVNGLTTGLDWTSPRTLSGGAYGTEVSNGADFTDSIANLAGLGTWGWHQRARGTLRITNQTNRPPYIEAELFLHLSISANVATGYELTLSNAPNDPYIQINRWNGALGSFTLLTSGVQGTAGFGTLLADGDIFELRDEGTSSVPKLVVYQNGRKLTGLTYDTTPDGTKYTGGAPGIGFYNHDSGAGSPNTFHNYIQWSKFDASDDYFDGELVQSGQTAPNTSATSTALAFGSNVVKGNTLVAACYHAGSVAATFADTRGNAWSVIGGIANATDGHRIDYAVAIAKDAGASTVTATHSGDAATTFRSLVVAEIRSGFAADKSASATGNGTAASSGASGTTAAAFELLLGMLGGANANGSPPTPDTTTTTSFVSIQDVVMATKWMQSLLFRLAYAIGTFTNSATIPTQQWSALVNTLSLVSTQALVNYRFRNDDGSETSATWMQPELTGASVKLGQVFRARFQIDTTGDEPSQPLTLQYRKVGTTTWFSVNTVSLVQLVTSANIASGAATATTAQLTSPVGKSGADFTAGKISDDTNPITGVDIGFSGYSEFEFALRLGSAPTSGEQYEFQLSGTSMSNTVTPRITVVTTPAGSVPIQLRHRGR